MYEEYFLVVSSIHIFHFSFPIFCIVYNPLDLLKIMYLRDTIFNTHDTYYVMLASLNNYAERSITLFLFWGAPTHILLFIHFMAHMMHLFNWPRSRIELNEKQVRVLCDGSSHGWFYCDMSVCL